MKCNAHIGSLFSQCDLEVEPVYTIDTIKHTPAEIIGFICADNHVRITRPQK
jgi:hypothetical protein